MMDAKLSHDHIRRRILDNLAWGNLPYHVIEPLPPLVVPPPAPRIPVSEPPKPPPRSAIKRFAKKLITTVPFLGRVAIILMMPFLVPLGLAAAVASRLQSIVRRIDHLIR